MRATTPEVGRWMTREEIRRRDKVAILGTTVVHELFGDENPIGETIKINRINFKVIGVAPEKGMGGHRDQDDTLYIPVTTAMYRLLGKDYLDGLYVEVSEPELVDEAQDAIRRLIIKRHRLKDDDDDSFHIRDMGEIKEMLSSTTKTMSFLLGAIAAISLVVGGIGIMNIMLVSVSERTREIGIRKAIGACKADILIQFLIEAAFMTLSGGIAGILLGIMVSTFMARVAGWTVSVTTFSVILATVFSVAVGLVFGLWPARQAARLDPIEALRYE
jgi:macrolide transport system ATP-binding/permease protein